MNEIELVEYTNRLERLHREWGCKGQIDAGISKLEAEVVNAELKRRGLDCQVIKVQTVVWKNGSKA